MVSASLAAKRREGESKSRLRLWVRLLRATRTVEAVTRERFKSQFNMTLPRLERWIDALLGSVTLRAAEHLSAILTSFRSDWESET